jgi:hypothetical protein
MFIQIILGATLSISGITGLGAAKSIFAPPPSPWLAPFFAIATVLILVVALLIWSLKPAFTYAQRAGDPKEQIAVVAAALEPILKVLKLMPKAPTGEVKNAGKPPDSTDGH